MRLGLGKNKNEEPTASKDSPEEAEEVEGVVAADADFDGHVEMEPVEETPADSALFLPEGLISAKQLPKARDYYLVFFEAGDGPIRVNGFLRIEDAKSFIEDLMEAGCPKEGIRAAKARGLITKVDHRPTVSLVGGRSS